MNWAVLLMVLEGASYVATIIGVVGVFLAISSYKESQNLKTKKELAEIENAKNKRVQNSIDVLRSFATNIIPGISEQESNWPSVFVNMKQQVVDQANDKFSKRGINKKITEKELPDDLIKKLITNAKMSTGMPDTFNNLEQLSIYMNYGMVEDDLAYPIIHNVFLNFVDRNGDVLDVLQSDEAPFANIHKLHNDWKKRNKIDSIDKQKKQLDNEKKKLESES